MITMSALLLLSRPLSEVQEGLSSEDLTNRPRIRKNSSTCYQESRQILSQPFHGTLLHGGVSSTEQNE